MLNLQGCVLRNVQNVYAEACKNKVHRCEDLWVGLQE